MTNYAFVIIIDRERFVERLMLAAMVSAAAGEETASYVFTCVQWRIQKGVAEYNVSALSSSVAYAHSKQFAFGRGKGDLLNKISKVPHLNPPVCPATRAGGVLA